MFIHCRYEINRFLDGYICGMLYEMVILARAALLDTARNKVYGMIYLTVSPSTKYTLVRTNEAPCRRRSLVQFSKLSSSRSDHLLFAPTAAVSSVRFGQLWRASWILTCAILILNRLSCSETSRTTYLCVCHRVAVGCPVR